MEVDMTWAGTVTMSAKELDRLEVLGRVAERRLAQRQAAEQLGVSEHQVRCLSRSPRNMRWAASRMKPSSSRLGCYGTIEAQTTAPSSAQSPDATPGCKAL